VVAPSGASGIEVEFGQATDPGLDPAKRINEDSCGYAETKLGHLFVVCDGMGGHHGGKEASDIAIRTIFEVVSGAPPGAEPGKILAQSIEEAGRRVYAFGGPPENQQRPGSTCVSILFHDGMVDVCHVGDSRAYAIRGKQIYRLTRDHSMVQELLDGGVISEQEAIGHPDSNKITRALGMTPEIVVERREEPMDLYEGDVFVLASDGLTDLARNDDILVTVNEYLKEQTVQDVCEELVALANRRGGHDNITVQVIRVMRASGKGVTRVQEPPVPGVTPTLEGSPAISPTVVQGPNLSDTQPEAPLGISTTAPDSPGPTIVDPPVNDGLVPPPISPPPMHSGMPMVMRQNSARSSKLVYLVLAMAGVIGLLLALLLWALFFR
jgi:PPM family protein phosphatase